MLRFGLVLLLATSALAAPGYSDYELVNLIQTTDISTAPNTGRSNHLTEGTFNLFDGGDTNVYILTLEQILNDLAASGERGTQSLGLGQALVTSLGLATGVPGDVCKAAALINGFASGNYRGPLKAFINHISTHLDLLVTYIRNPQAARFASGPRGTCSGSGRTYDFDGAWSKIIGNATPANAALLNEQYCSARRLYNAFNSRSNNIGALITAAAVPPFQKVIEQNHGHIAKFLSAIISNNNVNGALNSLRKGLSQAAQSV